MITDFLKHDGFSVPTAVISETIEIHGSDLREPADTFRCASAHVFYSVRILLLLMIYYFVHQFITYCNINIFICILS